MPNMHDCPPQFSGSFDEFVNQHMIPNLLSEKKVAEFHTSLVQYVNSTDAIYIIRYMRGLERYREQIDEQIYSTDKRIKIKASDNAPAWYIHYLLFNNRSFDESDEFKQLLDGIPTHMFDVKNKKTINSYGYHVAHLFDVKDGNTNYQTYTWQEMIKRFVRNVHPLNYFYIAKKQWRKYGAKIEIRAYIKKLFSSKYRDVWKEFIKLAQPTAQELDNLIYEDAYASFIYDYCQKGSNKGSASPGSFVPVGNIQMMMIDVKWKNYAGWKPWQYKSYMDQLEQIPGSKVRFNLLKNGQLRYCIEMNLAEWKEAMKKHMKTPSWITNESYWISFNKIRNGRYTEDFKPNWAPFVRQCNRATQRGC